MGKKRYKNEQPHKNIEGIEYPKKRFYRARAHSNPLNDSIFDVPEGPHKVNWGELFPAYFQLNGRSVTSQQNIGQQFQVTGGINNPLAGSIEPDASNRNTPHQIQNSESKLPDLQSSLVKFADIGCGFGGLIIQLATVYPNVLMLGMELRDKVTEYVKERIVALRKSKEGKSYQNVNVIRANAQKHLPHYLKKGQLNKIFFLFPDPHFKVANHRRRIINYHLLTEYAYFLEEGGYLYTNTDVEELAQWMKDKLEQHPLFKRVSDDVIRNDKAYNLLDKASEEAQKVERNNQTTWKGVYKRIRVT